MPEQGDWYAQRLYNPNDSAYKYHVEHYGHPSKFGFKDIIPLWKAEQWDPDRLMALYKKAGAKYFCMIAEHHDNFDCWNSKYQRWNSVNMGPKRDIAGEWQKAAKKHGLRFGMTEHLAASWWFYSSGQGRRQDGPAGRRPLRRHRPALCGPVLGRQRTAQGELLLSARPGLHQAGMVRSDQGHDRPLSSRPALQRQSPALPRRVRPQASGPLLQRQRAAARRPRGGRL